MSLVIITPPPPGGRYLFSNIFNPVLGQGLGEDRALLSEAGGATPGHLPGPGRGREMATGQALREDPGLCL